MRKLLLLFLAILPLNAIMAENETATEAVKNMGLGWNLGNTLDASGGAGVSPTEDTYWHTQGIDSETYWGQPVTKPELFTMMKKAGFGAIRVPCTWYNHMDKNGKVDPAWMKRVHEVVDYVISAGLYCIINVHHDTGADGGDFVSWIKADMDNYNANKERYEYLWRQIAEEFKEYDGKLIFGAFNEMLDKKSSWCFAGFNTNPYDSQIATSAYNAINSYAQSFVNTVRAVGGKNADRNLIINTYASACGTGNWNTHLQEPLKNLKYPEDSAKSHIIFEVHTYPAISNKSNTGVVTNRSFLDIKKEVDELFSVAKTHLVSKGAPVIFGEWGTSNVDAGAGNTDYDVRKELMFQFVDYFVNQARENGFGLFYWMGLTDGLYRNYPAFSQADLAERMAKAYHGSTFKGEFPVMDTSDELICFEGTKVLAWGNGISIAADLFKKFGKGTVIEISYTQTAGADDYIQSYYGDWSVKPAFIVDGKTYSSGDFSASKHYGTPANTNHVTVMSFSDDVYATLMQKGLILHGTGATIKKVSLKSASSAITLTQLIPTRTSGVVYNLSGQKVGKGYKGIVIVNGKKVMK